MKAHNTPWYVIISAATVLTRYWPLALRRVESFLSQVQFSMPPFQGWGSAACVERHCHLSVAFDKIIYNMKNSKKVARHTERVSTADWTNGLLALHAASLAEMGYQGGTIWLFTAHCEKIIAHFLYWGCHTIFFIILKCIATFQVI